ncbi:MAG: YhbY family RNA-binding protein [Verrucomicrobia bacterium]|nr:YhbY family RNA-binding protein [Verrucomicrobiota bacterium]
MQPTLTSADRRRLKGKAQLLEPVLKVGHNGVGEAFLASVERELALHELIKIKFADFKEERRELSERIALATQSALLQVVGHVAVFYRPRPKAEQERQHPGAPV